MLSPCLFMTIYEILIAVIIKTDTDNLKCNKKNDIHFFLEICMHDETSNWLDTGKTTVRNIHGQQHSTLNSQSLNVENKDAFSASYIQVWLRSLRQAVLCSRYI